MGNEQFVRCRNCEAIHHVTQFDKAPLYARLGGEIIETSADDWRAFVDRHAGHKLEPLKATGQKYFPNGQAADPMAVAYIEVTDGHERFLLRRARKSIDAPLQFALVKGRLADAGFRLQVQEAEIRKEMKHHFGWAPAQPLGDGTIDVFIALVREVVKEIDPRSIRISEDSLADSNVAYGRLGATEVDSLLAKCAAHFTGAALESIRRFVEAHRENSDVMTVIMRRHMAIETAN